MDTQRRRFVLATAALGIPTLGALTARADDKKKEDNEEVTATEDLMREHGVLNRILLVFEEGLRRLQAKEDPPPEVFHRPAELVRKFVEDYHEKLEENFIFPAFEKRKKLVELTSVLRQQHQAGRAVTDLVLRLTTPEKFRKPENRDEMRGAIVAFIHMYRPHEAREDTVLFPALHHVLSAQEIKDLGEQFEKEEDRLFGEEGFEKTVDQVAAIEKQLNVYELAQFTPKIVPKPEK
jgi:hemerythrin-like domain-containing protein